MKKRITTTERNNSQDKHFYFYLPTIFFSSFLSRVRSCSIFIYILSLPCAVAAVAASDVVIVSSLLCISIFSFLIPVKTKCLMCGCCLVLMTDENKNSSFCLHRAFYWYVSVRSAARSRLDTLDIPIFANTHTHTNT